MPIPIPIRQQRFWPAFLLGMAVTSTYPLALLFVLEGEAAFQILRNEITWSVYSLLLIPMGFGLMLVICDLDVFRRIPRGVAVGFGLVFFLGVGGIFYGVLGDSEGIPTPDRIASKLTSGRNYQADALSIDRCLRSQTECPQYTEMLDAVPACRKQYQYQNEYRDELWINPAGVDQKTLDRWYEGAIHKHAYFCAMLAASESKSTELPKSAMAYVAILLNFLLIVYIWCFIWISHVYFAYARQDLGEKALNILVGCFVILITWFPFRAYSEWYLWYGDLSHMWNYPPYWVLFVFALELLVLYAIWIVTQRTGTTLLVAIPSVYGVVATAFAVIAGVNPRLLELFFGVFTRLPNALYVILVCGVVLILGIYSQALLRQQ